MAVTSTYVHDLPLATNVAQFEIPGFDLTTNSGAKALMSTLKGATGATGATPNIAIQMVALPYGNTPTVTKTGTATSPNFVIGFPLAQDGRTPMFQKTATYIQYRYSTTEAWQNLIAIDDLKLKYTDLTAAQIAELQQPAIEGKANADTAAQNANDAAQAANIAATDAEDAAQEARDAIANIKDGKTPQFSSATATELSAGQQPTATVTNVGTDTDGNPLYSLNFGIPDGEQGIQGNQGLSPIIENGEITTGAAGSNAQLIFSYVGDDINGAPIYVVSGSIPQGAAGTGNGNVEVDQQGLIGGNQYVFVPNNNNSSIGTFQPVTIPDTQVQADWNELDTTQKSYIQNKPNLSAVAISGDYNDLSNAPSGSYNDLTDKPNLTPEFQTSNAYSSTATGVTETIQIRSIENGIGIAQNVNLPVANETNAGVMPASAFTQIQQNTATIQSLIEGGGKEWPSVETKADLDAFGMPAGATQNDVIKVRDDETQGGATTQYVATDNGNGLEWVFNMIINYDPIGIATTTTTGVVKSSEQEGQVLVETDGTMSLNGYDTLGNRINTLETGTVKLAGSQNITGVKTFINYPVMFPLLNQPNDNNSLTKKSYVDTKQPLLTSANAGEGISIDTTNPQVPIISSTGGGSNTEYIDKKTFIDVMRGIVGRNMHMIYTSANTISSYVINSAGQVITNSFVQYNIESGVRIGSFIIPWDEIRGIHHVQPVGTNTLNMAYLDHITYEHFSMTYTETATPSSPRSWVGKIFSNFTLEYLNFRIPSTFRWANNMALGSFCCNLPNLSTLIMPLAENFSALQGGIGFENVKNDPSCILYSNSINEGNLIKSMFPSLSNWTVKELNSNPQL